MQMAKAFRQIVKWDNVLEAKLRKCALDRHIGRSDDAHCDTGLVFHGLRHVSGMEQSHSGPASNLRFLRGVAVDSHDKIMPYRF